MKKILIVAPVFSNAGYGVHARTIVNCLRELKGVDLYLAPTQWAHASMMSDQNEDYNYYKHLFMKHVANQQGAKLQYDISIQVMVPHEFQQLCPVNIGVTAGVESSKISPQWIESCNKMHKIITISEFSKDIIADTIFNHEGTLYNVVRPVEYVGYPVVEQKEKVKLNLDLNTDFNFLFVGQWAPRKNIEQMIRWFIECFHNNPNVGLIVKTNTMNNCTQDRFHTETRLKELIAQYQNKKCSVYLLHGPMTDAEVDALYYHDKIKCFVSTTNAEGWGLGHFQAAYSGMPIVTTDYSGYKDFLYWQKEGGNKKKPFFATVDYVLKNVQPEAVVEPMILPDSQWAFPKENSYKQRLLEIYKDYGRFKKQASELKDIVCEEFTFEKIKNKFNSFIEEFLPKENEEQTEIGYEVFD